MPTKPATAAVLRPMLLAVAVILGLSQPAIGQTSDDGPKTTPPTGIRESVGSVGTAGMPGVDDRIPFEDIPQTEGAVLSQYLEAADWPIRVFGLLRLERYHGARVEKIIRAHIQHSAWQVRCFALRQAYRMGYDLSRGDLTELETDPRVIRTAVRVGVAFEEDELQPLAMRLMRTRGIEELMMGIEIAAATEDEVLRTEALKRLSNLLRNMNASVATLMSRRLAVLLAIPIRPTSVDDWRAWSKSVDGTVSLPPAGAYRASAHLATVPLVASLTHDQFARLLDYLDLLRRRDLELAVVMDATSSMIPMINQARTGVDSFIMFLNDISKTMRLAIIAYRDHDNKPVWEGQRFTDDIASIRKFLFGLRITGGADLPEAVLDGLEAAEDLNWNPYAARQIILVGDARPHDDDIAAVLSLAGVYQDRGIIVHAIHTPMVIRRELRGRLSAAYLQEVDNHNARTEAIFDKIAQHGGGTKVTLQDSEQLVPTIMHTALDEAWWTVFDEFYAMYLDLCR